jgi:putative copper export protein
VWLEDDERIVVLGPVSHAADDRTTLVASVPPVARGMSRVGFHAVAVDGDVLRGSADVTAGTDRIASSTHGDDLPPGVARIVLDAALATLVGGVAFVATVWPQGAGTTVVRRLLAGAVHAAALASAMAAVVQHAAATGLSMLDAVAPAHVAEILHFRFGRVAVVRLCLLAVASALATRLDRSGGAAIRSRQWCAAAGAVGVGLFETIVLLGHHSHAGPMGGVARFAHAVGVSVWFGGLVVLLAAVLPRRRADEVGAVLRRFSTLATAAVALALVAGVGLAIELAGVAAVAPSTPYGRTLLLKVAVVALLLLVAARARRRARRWFVAAADQRRASPSLAVPMAAVVGVELALLVLVLALTARLVSQTPPV